MPLLAPLSIPNPSSDAILNAFLEYLEREKIEPYGHQEEAVLELYEGKNVILNTPTGSGKSLVALACHFRSLCLGRRSYYTVPIKALANEKFLSLCQTFGPEKVGMITGDATVNRDAPIICCTAEILSNIALREGAKAAVDDVIMDEFHYYADHSRGVAWQVPLLTLPQARFLLMSATLGDTQVFEKALSDLTGAETSLVTSNDRPVPLEFIYSETPLEEKVVELVEANKAPVYLVHFTQLACARTAQNLLSSNFCSKEEKKAIAEALADANFRSPYGKEISKLLRHGLGIHHAGLLPKYRVLVEKLTQKGLLKVICGTDTLGVGINVPIRTVLFTQLCKYDGQGTKILSVRDFKQIAGRAGRRGHDSEGYVVAQAPEHVIDNLRLEAKAAANTKKKSKIVKRKPPEKGYVGWEESTFRKLNDSPPETLVSRFSIQHGFLLNVLSRKDEDGCAEIKRLIQVCHEAPNQKATLKKQAFSLFRSLVQGKILHILPPAKREGPNKVILDVDLPEDFSLNQALGLYLLDTIPELDAETPSYVLDLLSLVEAILENPDVILRKQVDKLKTERVEALKREGVPYEERMAQLEEIEYPKPNKDFIYDTFNAFAAKHPWVAGGNIRPKAIAREMFENYQSFENYIDEYGLQRSEGVLLRHLAEVYKVLAQTVPPSAKNEIVEEAEAFFEAMVRGVDSSLLDEWEKLRNPAYVPEERAQAAAAKAPPITRNRRAFVRLIRNQLFTLLKAAARRDWEMAMDLIEPNDPEGVAWTPSRIDALFREFYETRQGLRLDPEARNTQHTFIDSDTDPKHWRIEQVLIDLAGENDHALHLVIDLPLSEMQQRPVLLLGHLKRIGT